MKKFEVEVYLSDSGTNDYRDSRFTIVRFEADCVEQKSYCEVVVKKGGVEFSMKFAGEVYQVYEL